MSRFSFRSIRSQPLIVVFILVFGLIAGFLLLRVESLTPVQKDEEAGAGEPAADGPHQGVVLGKERPIRLEAVDQHQGRSRLKLSFYALKGEQTLKPAQAQLQIRIKRLGKTSELALKPEDEGWVGRATLEEPHSFSLEATLKVEGQSYSYQWEHPENRLVLSPEQQKASGLSFATAGPRTLSETLELPGKIAVNQDRYAHITPRLSGIVTHVYKHLGESVAKGELLAVLESRELGDLRLEYLEASQRWQQARKRYQLEQGFFTGTAQLLRGLEGGQNIEVLHRQLLAEAIGADRETLISAYAAYRLAFESFAREQRLWLQKATSEAEYQQAEKALIAARAAYQAAIEEVGRQRRLQLLSRQQEVDAAAPAVEIARRKLETLGLSAGSSSVRYELRAPLSGNVISSHIVVGESLGADLDVFVLADLSEVWAEMMIPESQLETVKLRQRVEVVSQTGKYQAAGVVSHLAATVDEESRTAEAHAEVANPQRIWKPGMFVTLRLESNPFTVPVAIRQTAVQSMEGENVVFLRDGEALQAVPVELGRRGQGWVEVRKGLSPGQTYVAANSFLIKAELEKALASED